MRRPLRKISAALALALALAGPARAEDAPAPLPDLALMGTIPVYWGEVDGLGELLAAGSTGHWARGLLEQAFRLTPLDFLSAAALRPHRRLLLAQPRALAAEENLALDGWVRGGGQLLLFADPLMTGESRFALGDRRRPQDVVLLSPLLAHWGLDLGFPEDQPGARLVPLGGGLTVPVNAAGQLALRDGASGCRLAGEGLAADCRIGAGHVLILADAALLDLQDPAAGACAALAGLVRAGFGNLLPLSATTESSRLENGAISGQNSACPVGFGHPKGVSDPP